MVVCACLPSYTGSLNRRIKVQASLSIHTRSYLKNNQKQKKREKEQERADVQLSGRVHAGSIPTTTKKRQKTKELKGITLRH
jgi:hypothetical protein